MALSCCIFTIIQLKTHNGSFEILKLENDKYSVFDSIQLRREFY